MEKKSVFLSLGYFIFLYFCSHINFSANFLISSCSWIQFHCVYVSHCLYPFISWWMSRMTLCSSWCEYIKHEQGCAVYLCEKIKSPFSTWPVMVQSGHIIILFFGFLKKISKLISILAAWIYSSAKGNKCLFTDIQIFASFVFLGRNILTTWDKL